MVSGSCLLSACGTPAAVPASPVAPAAASTDATISSLASPAAPTPAITPTQTVQDWLMPYTLAGLRKTDFGEAKLLGREETAKTSLYKRYAITYLSDGLEDHGDHADSHSGQAAVSRSSS